LEMVRQLFEQGVLQSGFWHQFALTAHSPVGLAPAEYGIEPDYQEITFANNDIQFTDSTGIDHDIFSYGLKKSLYNYMHGACFDFGLQEWFDFEIPETTIEPDFILSALEEEEFKLPKESAKVTWLGAMPLASEFADEEGNEYLILQFHDKIESIEVTFERAGAF